MDNSAKTIKTFGYSIYSDDLENLPSQKKILINTINQFSFCIAERDKVFKRVLQDSDVLLPDGIGIVAASRFLNGQRIPKIAGAKVHNFLLEKLKVEKGSCFYLGSSDATLKKIRDRISKDYPEIKVGSYSPPFKKSFSKTDSDKMLKAVNDFKPDVLFVGMTAPKQEKWVYAHKAEINVNIICSIGAVFDFYSGNITRPVKFMRDMGLEWLGRLIKEPRRMHKRYIYYGFVFAYHLMQEKFKLHKMDKSSEEISNVAR